MKTGVWVLVALGTLAALVLVAGLAFSAPTTTTTTLHDSQADQIRRQCAFTKSRCTAVLAQPMQDVYAAARLAEGQRLRDRLVAVTPMGTPPTPEARAAAADYQAFLVAPPPPVFADPNQRNGCVLLRDGCARNGVPW